MSSDRDHPSASAYNKFDTKTLMGNWQEELALKATTGVPRVQVGITVRLVSLRCGWVSSSAVAAAPTTSVVHSLVTVCVRQPQ
jgi:hypothetical protein